MKATKFPKIHPRTKVACGLLCLSTWPHELQNLIKKSRKLGDDVVVRFRTWGSFILTPVVYKLTKRFFCKHYQTSFVDCTKQPSFVKELCRTLYVSCPCNDMIAWAQTDAHQLWNFESHDITQINSPAKSHRVSKTISSSSLISWNGYLERATRICNTASCKFFRPLNWCLFRSNVYSKFTLVIYAEELSWWTRARYWWSLLAKACGFGCQ